MVYWPYLIWVRQLESKNRSPLIWVVLKIGHKESKNSLWVELKIAPSYFGGPYVGTPIYRTGRYLKKNGTRNSLEIFARCMIGCDGAHSVAKKPRGIRRGPRGPYRKRKRSKEDEAAALARKILAFYNEQPSRTPGYAERGPPGRWDDLADRSRPRWHETYTRVPGVEQEASLQSSPTEDLFPITLAPGATAWITRTSQKILHEAGYASRGPMVCDIVQELI